MDANRSLQKMDMLKSAFLSSASHELRTPLTSVLGFAKLMHKRFRQTFLPLAKGDPHLESKAREFSENFLIIEQEGRRLTRLINDLLDLNKIESGRMEWRDRKLDLGELLGRALKAVQGQFASKPELELRSDIPGGLPSVYVDPDRITQVAINLLNNAAKFTEQGSVTLRAMPDGHNWVNIQVEDTGSGIPEEELERIFDKFYQSQQHDELSDKPLGTGLGLAICRQIVEHYGGRIWASSAEGRGSTFTFSLPVQSQG
jgi:signal transduction histidine kinase